MYKPSPAASGPLSTLSSTLSQSLRGSVRAALGIEKVERDAEAVARIRRAMMQLHGASGLDLNPRFHRRIASKQDAEGLWYARAELYADLCQLHNEPYAMRCLQSLLPLFRGTLQASLLKTRAPNARPGGSSTLQRWQGDRVPRATTWR